MNAEQIHQRLSMFLQAYDWTLDQLLKLLKSRMRDDLLEQTAGKFKLKGV